MSDATNGKAGWKQKAVAEFVEYWAISAYLFWFFAVFTWFRRFVLAEYHISYAHYSFALVEALVLAKLILIGDAFHFGRRFDERPLIVPTLWKAAVFSVWVAAFNVLEHTVEGLLRHRGLTGGLEEMASTGKYEVLSRCLIMFSVFIPFFACRQLGRVLGEGQLVTLFFRGRGPQDPGNSPRTHPPG
jgi:hypothetical protein